MSEVIIDVRERDEFEAKHIPGSISIPLSEFHRQAPNVLAKLNQEQVTIMCLSGKRSQLAYSQIEGFGINTSKFVVFAGGIKKWEEDGGEVTHLKSDHLPILRQVHLVAGGVILMASIFSYLLEPVWAFVSAFFGAGLFVAGATGFCGMATVLAQMPWNRSVKNLKEEVKIANSGTDSCAKP